MTFALPEWCRIVNESQSEITRLEIQCEAPQGIFGKIMIELRTVENVSDQQLFDQHFRRLEQDGFRLSGCIVHDDAESTRDPNPKICIPVGEKDSTQLMFPTAVFHCDRYRTVIGLQSVCPEESPHWAELNMFAFKQLYATVTIQ